MGAFVILRHETPDGGHHFDVMLQRGPGEALITFRTEAPLHEFIEEARGARFGLQRIGEHRGAYLTFEGELSGGRGRVRRVAAGEAVLRGEAADLLEAEISGGGGSGRLRLFRAGDSWRGEYTPGLVG